MPERVPSQPENALQQDVPQLAHLLSVSLFDDPLQRWLFPDEPQRLRASAWMFRRLMKERIARGLVRVIRDADGLPVSVANWTPPHPPAPTPWQRRMESLFMRWIFGKRIHKVRAGFRALAERLPPQPNWYLQVLATADRHRGSGHAKRLLLEKFDECDASKLVLALQTSNLANLTYYQKLGFQVEHELMLTAGLPVWLMCRSPS